MSGSLFASLREADTWTEEQSEALVAIAEAALVAVEETWFQVRSEGSAAALSDAVGRLEDLL